MLFKQTFHLKSCIPGILFFTLICINIQIGWSQDRCGTNAHTQMLLEKNTLRQTTESFEDWMQQKLSISKLPLSTQRTEAGPYQVPVVVHVIHNGESIGQGVNISEAQILSQLDVLNNDFKRLNADAASTPAEFLPVAGAFEIEFVMAKQDPEGLATNGIVRVNGSKSQWTISDNYELKAQSYWPAEDYLNIWVTNLGGGIIGFAQFPVSPLPGLEIASNNRLTDGVVIHYRAFGSSDAGSFDLDSRYNKGRTTTHELGHFFGLRHLSGDENSCSSTDYVDDTPIQLGNTTGCPAHPKNSCSSPGNDMFQNFLDYSNDVCMNLFTLGQVERMEIVIENSPRRLSLLTSNGLLAPAPSANDLGIREILTPTASECSGISTPTIEVVNYGNNNVTSARITIKKDGIGIETIDFPLNLAPLEEVTLVFSSQNFGSSNFEFSAEIILTNGTTDGNPNNNIQLKPVAVQPTTTLPFYETFLTVPVDWKISNPDQAITWVNELAPGELPGNRAMKLNFYDYEDNYGEVDIITTPVFDLTSAPVALLTFDVAHAQFKNTLSNDGLKVFILTDCNSEILGGDEIYYKTGSTLATVAAQNNPFTPVDASSWRKEVIDLSAFLSESNVQLAFVGINDYGNNLYLDNINLITSAVEDLSLVELVSPGPVTCDESPAPVLSVQNQGSTVITEFKVQYGVDGGTPTATTISGINLNPGQILEVTVPPISLATGDHELFFALTDPNGLIDINPSNSERSYSIIIDQSENLIPLRENFDSGFAEWTIVNPAGGEPWEIVTTNYAKSMSFQAFENTVVGDQSWLVSPTLDFSKTDEASIFFDIAYAFRTNTSDQLQVRASIDCGQHYDILLYDRAGENLSTTDSETGWTPFTESDWVKEYINLNLLAGEKEVRIAFVFTNDNGNNIFIDNIEFYISDDTTPPQTEKPFVVYMTQVGEFGDFKITFNLEQRQDVGMEVVDMMGRSVTSQLLPDILNQTYSVSLTDAATGIYIVRLQLNGSYFATRVYVAK